MDTDKTKQYTTENCAGSVAKLKQDKTIANNEKNLNEVMRVGPKLYTSV